MSKTKDFFVTNGTKVEKIPEENFFNCDFFKDKFEAGDFIAFFHVETVIKNFFGIEITNQKVEIYDYRIIDGDGNFYTRREQCDVFVKLIRANTRPGIMIYPVCGGCRKITKIPSNIHQISLSGLCSDCHVESLLPLEKDNEKVN